MVKVIFVDHNGSTQQTEANPGNTVMQTAAINGVSGIEADCGGGCSCATCHVFVDDTWVDVVGPANPTEDAMLSLVAGRKDNSRLSCQIVVTEEMDGLVVTTPESQY